MNGLTDYVRYDCSQQVSEQDNIIALAVGKRAR